MKLKCEVVLYLSYLKFKLGMLFKLNQLHNIFTVNRQLFLKFLK